MFRVRTLLPRSSSWLILIVRCEFRMPLLALLYCCLLVCLGISSIRESLRDGEPSWFVAVNAASIAVLLLAFIGYWARDVVRAMGGFAPVLFLLSLGWEICTAGRGNAVEVRRYFPPHQRAMIKRFAMGLEILAAFPGYWFGGIAVLRTL